VHYLDNKVFDIVDALCNHEQSLSATNINSLQYCLG